MTRIQARTYARIAGYHGDRRTFTRLIVEARVARPAMLTEWANGERAKAAGVSCTCAECATPTPTGQRERS